MVWFLSTLCQLDITTFKACILHQNYGKCIEGLSLQLDIIIDYIEYITRTGNSAHLIELSEHLRIYFMSKQFNYFLLTCIAKRILLK